MEWDGISGKEMQCVIDRRLREELYGDEIKYSISFSELNTHVELNDDERIEKLQKQKLETRLGTNRINPDENTIMISMKGDMSDKKVEKLLKERKPIPLLPICADKSMISLPLLGSFLESDISGVQLHELGDIPVKSKRDYLDLFVKQQKSCTYLIIF